jgi:hypothetical protein
MAYTNIKSVTIVIFKGNCIPGDGYPVVIAAAGRRLDEYLVGEYYTFVCDREAIIYQQSVIMPAAESVLRNGYQTALDPSFMIDFLARLAEEKLNSHLYETQKNHSEPSFRKHVYRLERADPRHLLYVHLRGSYTQQLHRISKYTKFLELTHLIGSLETLEVARISEVKSPEESA